MATIPAEQDTNSLDFNFGSQEHLAAPWRALRKIAEVDPVFWSAGLNAWVITRHADIKAAYADARFRAARMDFFLRMVPGDAEKQFPVLVKYHRLSVALMDPPEHIRVRSLMMKAFMPKKVEALRPMIAEVIEETLARCEAAGEFDFIKVVSEKLPTRVIQAMLGVPAELTDEFFDLVSTILRAMGSLQPTEQLMADADRAVIRFNEIFTELIAERREAPTNDLLSALVDARDAGDRLSEDELLAACQAIIEAGSETTAHMLAVGVKEIAGREDLRRMVEESVETTKPVIDELLRFPGIVMGMTRIIEDPFEFRGRELKRGDVVFIMNVAGNVDPAVFENPETIDPSRNGQASLAFGPGLHHCIGLFLAKAELVNFLHQAFSRYDIALTGPEPSFVVSAIFRTYERLDVRFTPKLAASPRHDAKAAVTGS